MNVKRGDKGQITWLEVEIGYCDGGPVVVLAEPYSAVMTQACSFVRRWIESVGNSFRGGSSDTRVIQEEE